MPITRSRTAEKLNQPIIAKINHAMTLLSNNHVSKAAQVLCREDSMKNIGEELVRSQLIELHPVSNVSIMPSPSSLEHSVFINPMDKNMFKNIIKRQWFSTWLFWLDSVYDISIIRSSSEQRKVKTSQIRQRVKRCGCCFCSICYESYGGLATQAKEFIKTLGVWSQEHGATISTHDLISGLRYASVAWFSAVMG